MIYFAVFLSAFQIFFVSSPVLCTAGGKIYLEWFFGGGDGSDKPDEGRLLLSPGRLPFAIFFCV